VRQDKIYINREGKYFYFVPELTDTGIALFIFDDMPSKYTEEEQAIASVTLAVEESDDTTRVIARLYDSETQRAGHGTHVITLVEEVQGTNERYIPTDIPPTGFSLALQAIQQRIQERWNEASLRPLPSEDPFDQAIFFAGMADEVEKELSEQEQLALRDFIFALVGIEEDGEKDEDES
jgi:hypothetical protein